jgi:hypothetical protein
MIRQVIGLGATGLLLVAVLYHPGIAAAHGGTDMEQDPACAWQVRAWCISVLISPNTD